MAKWKPRMTPTPGSTPSKPRSQPKSHGRGLKMPSTHRKPPKYEYSQHDLLKIAGKAVKSAHRPPKKSPPNIPELPKKEKSSGKWRDKKTGNLRKKEETVAENSPRRTTKRNPDYIPQVHGTLKQFYNSSGRQAKSLFLAKPKKRK